jgi:hypothetical protein
MPLQILAYKTHNGLLVNDISAQIFTLKTEVNIFRYNIYVTKNNIFFIQ